MMSSKHTGEMEIVEIDYSTLLYRSMLGKTVLDGLFILRLTKETWMLTQDWPKAFSSLPIVRNEAGKAGT